MIRPIYKEELEKSVEVIRKSFSTVAEEFGFTVENAPRFTAFATDLRRLEWQYHREQRPMFVYVDGQGEICGYYSLYVRENQECELNNLCVLPEYRHMKIGEKLLKHAFVCAAAFGCAKMTLGIVEENQRLRMWYESFGIAHTGTEKFDFFPFTCGYMEKDLKFGFLDTGDLRDGEIVLELERTIAGNAERNWLPAYRFHICNYAGEKMGVCDLRVGYSRNIYYGGNIGYRIEEEFRGSHYAGKACRLLFELAKRHGMDYLVITCNPDNYASAKTCEYAGGVLREIAELPEDNDMRQRGETSKRIYTFSL